MDIIVVLVLGIAAGVGVYLVSMRWDRPVNAMPGEGFLPEEERMQAEALQAAAEVGVRPQGGEYVPLAPGRRSVQTRLLGVLGIVVLVPIAAIAFAIAAYGVGRVVVETITKLVQSAST